MKNLEITASTAFLYEIIQRIETISRRDPGGRGLAAHVTQEQLLPAARELMTGTRIVIVTGFCIRAVMAGETDGPPGALALADEMQTIFAITGGKLESEGLAFDNTLQALADEHREGSSK